MSNEQEITIKVKVPEGEYCRECMYKDYLVNFTNATCGLFFITLVYGLTKDSGYYTKCPQCKDACEKRKA